MTHTVVRVYSDGSRFVSYFHTKSSMDAHLGYSVVARFGCAHFRNGKCVSTGYLGKERCEHIEEELLRAKGTLDSSIPSSVLEHAARQ